MKDLKDDFASFADDSSAPGSGAILASIHQQIALESYSVGGLLAKIAGAHLLASLVTLMSCSQFGVRLFFDGSGLMHYFMHVAPDLCMVFCGALYFTLSLNLIRLFTHKAEWKAFQKNALAGVGVLAFLTLAGFIIGTSQVTWLDGSLWIVGAFLAGGVFAKWPPARGIVTN